MAKDKKSKKAEKLTPEIAKVLLKAEGQARIQRCLQKIQQALAEENCLLELSMIITAQGNIPQLIIRVAPETE